MKAINILTSRKSQLLALSIFILIIVIALAGAVSSPSPVNQAASTTTVYLDPPTIDGTVIDQEFTVNINIRDAIDVYSWQAGLLFNNTVLNCAGFEWGDFLSDAAGAFGTFPIEGTINNTVGEVVAYGETLLGPEDKASGDGTLISFNFTVIAPGVSDLHLRDVIVSERVGTDIQMVAANIIDVFTVVLDTTQHKVVTVSNTTGATGQYASGFSGHTFTLQDKEIGFNVVGPYVGFANVTIPKALVSVQSPDEWKVKVDEILVNRTVTFNGTHYSIHFTYDVGIHSLLITAKRDLGVSLEAPNVLLFDESTLLSANVYNLGVNDEANVTFQLLIGGAIVNSTIISLLPAGQYYMLSYLWAPPAVKATYNVTANAPPLPGEALIDNNIATKIVTVRSLILTPESGPAGTKVNVEGVKFGNQTQVSVTFNDMLMGYALTDENGSFTFVFNIPFSVSGIQIVKAFDATGNYGDGTFSVIDATPLDVGVDVGTIHFKGELAEFYIQTTFKGIAVNATSVNATLYGPNNEVVHYQFPDTITSVATGLYEITYAIPIDAPNGTYILMAESSYFRDNVEAYGTSFKTFLLSPTLAAFEATLISLNGTVAWLETEIGTIETNITDIGLKVTEIDGDIATIQTTLGTIEGRITSIEGDIAIIETDIGSVKADVSTIKGTQETFVIPQYAAVALAFIAAIGATLIIFLLRRKPTS